MKFKSSVYYILLVFLLIWLALYLVYSGYMHYFNETLQTIDPYTSWVAESAKSLLNFMGWDALTFHPKNAFYKWIYLDDQYASVVNEGCNGVSVMIVYLSFIIAFAQKWKTTFFYLLITLVIFVLINIGRVAWMTYIYRYYPDFSKTAHDLVFPAIIYGYIVFAWVVWMRYFVFKNKKK